MNDLPYKLAWGRGRVGELRACKRLYYLRRYVMWGGWDQAAPRVKQQCYILSKMSSLPMCVGNGVHRAISVSIARLKAGLDYRIDPQPFIRSMELTFDAADEQRWWNVKRAKQCPPFQETFPNRERFTKEQREWAKDRFTDRFQTFLSCDTLSELADNRDAITWHHIGHGDSNSPESFMLGDIEVYSDPDLCISWADKCTIYDWKTGKADSGDDGNQLDLYALYAQSRGWVSSVEDLQGWVVPLDGDNLVRQHRYTQQALDALQDTIRQDYREMEALHPAGLAGDESAFPARERDSRCERCDYRVVC